MTVPESYHDDDGRISGGSLKSGDIIELDLTDIRPGFAIRRVYTIFGTQPGVIRGMHAHRNLEQVAHVVSGSCTFTVDNGEGPRTVRLIDPREGIYIGPMAWREMSDFTADCVLVVFASQPYDPQDYIRDYVEWQKLVVPK